MNDSDVCVLEFLGILADAHRHLRQLGIFAEKQIMLKSTSTSVMPMRLNCSSDYAENGATISLAVNSELVTPLDKNRKAIGASLLLRRASGIWISEAEIGWSGVDVGWDVIESREAQENDLARLASKISEQLEWLSSRFKSEINKFSP